MVDDGNTTREDSTDGAYSIRKYTWRTGNGTTTWDVPVGVTEVEYLVIGAGGSGYYGGGGAGGLRENSATKDFAVAGSLTVTVGNGAVGFGGEDSVFSTVTAVGGGQDNYNGNGGNGGCGGGAGLYGGTGVATGGIGSVGYNGGDGTGIDGTYLGHGGGGGMGSVGTNGTWNTAGNGGAGIANSITGTPVTYCSGGCGSAMIYPTRTYGTGINVPTASLGEGSGAGVSATAGSSGVVIIRYLTPVAAENLSGIGMGSANMMTAGV